tara:strand:- start:160 stop:450 length:291 start_codon:yes stop_codon:yes gene_type:complete
MKTKDKSPIKTLNIDVSSHIAVRTEVQNFLEKFAKQDYTWVSQELHVIRMRDHYYYVDYRGQGWYVSDSTQLFHRLLTEEENWAYMETYDNATSYR